jgi:hypothetical protein
METKMTYFIVYYHGTSSTGQITGSAGIKVRGAFFNREEFHAKVMEGDKNIKWVTITGFDRLTEEEYNIFLKED